MSRVYPKMQVVGLVKDVLAGRWDARVVRFAYSQQLNLHPGKQIRADCSGMSEGELEIVSYGLWPPIASAKKARPDERFIKLRPVLGGLLGSASPFQNTGSASYLTYVRPLFIEPPSSMYRQDEALTLCGRHTGHNGCIQCMSNVQARRPECPLCRSPFDSSAPLTLNHQLRDLVALANSLQIDEQTRKEGWDTFPTARATAEQYSSELGDLAKKGGV